MTDHTFIKKTLDDESTPLSPDTSETTQKSASAQTQKKERKQNKKKAAASPKKTKTSLTKEEANTHEDWFRLDDERKKHIDEDLRHIYSDRDGVLPDMSTFQTKGQGGVVRAFGALLLSLVFFAAVVWFGFFSMESSSRFSERDVIVAVNGPEEIAIGDTVRYRIKYTNDQSVPLTAATLQIRYPVGFVFESSTLKPTNEAQDTWELGAIDARASDAIEIVGRLYGDIDTEQSLRAFFTYTPANFSSEFQKVESARTLFTNSPIRLSVSGPEQGSIGALSTWTVHVDGIPADTSVVVELALPDQFTLSETQPQTDMHAPRQWTITGESAAELQFTGRFEAMTEAPIMVYASMPIDRADGMMLDRVRVATAQTSVVLSETDIVTNLLINGGMGDIALQAGDMLGSTLVVQNTGDIPMEQVTVRFVIDAPSEGTRTIYDWQRLIDDANGRVTAEQRGEQTRRAVIAWTSAQIPALRTIAPGEQVQIPFVLPILSGSQADLTAYTTFQSAAVGEITYLEQGETQTVSTNQITITVNSDLRLSTQHTVATNDAEQEVHTIVYLLENTFHALEDIRLTTDLYGDIVVDELLEGAGTAVFDEQTKTITWEVPHMPISVDVLPLHVTMTMARRNPTQTNLTSKVQVRARDAVTGEVITIVGSEILLAAP